MKKWGTYSYISKKHPEHIGIIVRYDKFYCDIKYSNNQLYDIQYWTMSYVCMFVKLENAIIYMLENLGKSLNKTKEELLNDFKKDAVKVKWKDLEIIEFYIKITK